METVIEVKPIDTTFVKDIAIQADHFLTTADGVVIKNQTEYGKASTVLKDIKSTTKTLTEKRRAITIPLDNAKKAVMDLFRKPIESLGKAEGIIKGAMITYTDEQEQIRREQEEKLARQAKAEEDRKKKALEEQARKQEEKAAEARRKAADAKDAEEKARLEADAKKADEEAEKRREKKEDVHVDAPVLAPRTETPKGVAYKDKWTAEVVDFGKLPNEYKLPNIPMLNRMAQAGKGKVPIPGVVFKSEKIVASKSS